MNGAQITGRSNVVDEHSNPIFIGPPWTIAAAAFFGPQELPILSVVNAFPDG